MLMNDYSEGSFHFVDSTKCISTSNSNIFGGISNLLDGILLDERIRDLWKLNWRQKESFSWLLEFISRHHQSCHLRANYADENFLSFIAARICNDIEDYDFLHVLLYCLLGFCRTNIESSHLIDGLLDSFISCHPDWTVRLVSMEIIKCRLASKQSTSLTRSLRHSMRKETSSELKIFGKSILMSLRRTHVASAVQENRLAQELQPSFLKLLHPSIFQIFEIDKMMLEDYLEGALDKQDALMDLSGLLKKTESELDFPLTTAQAIVLIKDQIYLKQRL